jgi:hypothetical protein
MHIYVISDLSEINLIDCISVTGIFENPLDLITFSTCCGCDDPIPCFDLLTTNYPLQPHYVDLIKAEVISELTRFMIKTEDKENNAEDDEEQANRGKN